MTQDKQLEDAAEKELDKKILYFPESNEMKHDDIKRNVIDAFVKAIKSDAAKQYWYEQFRGEYGKYLDSLKAFDELSDEQIKDAMDKTFQSETPQQPTIEAISAMAEKYAYNGTHDRPYVTRRDYIKGATAILSALGYSAGFDEQDMIDFANSLNWVRIDARKIGDKKAEFIWIDNDDNEYTTKQMFDFWLNNYKQTQQYSAGDKK